MEKDDRLTLNNILQAISVIQTILRSKLNDAENKEAFVTRQYMRKAATKEPRLIFRSL